MHYETSLGVAVSTDGGLTWRPASTGLEVAGVPHRFVRNLVVSPTFAADRALFAWAWGPPEPAEVLGLQRLGFANALFRSQDGGASWQAVWDRPQLVHDLAWGFNQSLGIALSPSYATDGVLLVTTMPMRGLGDTIGTGEYGARGPCEPRRSRDGGASWETLETPPVPENNRPSACGEPRFLDAGSGPFPARRRAAGRSDREDRRRRCDLDATDLAAHRYADLAADPGPRAGRLDAGARRPEVRDLDLRRPAAARIAPARPARSSPDAARFEAAARKISNARWYGCGLSPAAPVTIRERVVGSARGLWVDDDSPSWLLLRTDGVLEVAERHDKLTEPWTGPPSRVVEGVVQRTWTGEFLELPLPGGRRQAYAISDKYWEMVESGP